MAGGRSPAHGSDLLLWAGLCLIAAAWLVPNHYPPWAAFHSDAASALGLILLGIAALRTPGARQWPHLALMSLVACSIPALQWAAGLIHFAGDALMATLYVAGFAFAQWVGSSLVKTLAREQARAFWSSVLIAAVLSTGLGLYQWLGLSGLSILAIDLPPGGRPFANLGQPNHLSTLLWLGLVGAFALHECCAVSRGALALIVVFLCFGIAMTQSRTAWLVAAALGVWVWSIRDRAGLRLTRTAMVATVLLLGSFTLLWPSIVDWLKLGGGRTLGEQAEGGTRLVHWASMLDAIGRQPLRGYGWNQVSVAQSHVAIDHPATGELIEHSHNLILDLLVWNGVPLGLLLVAGLAWWFWRHICACRKPAVAWLLAGVGAVLIYAMLEYPLDYAYFLLPVGLIMGAIDALSPIDRHIAVPVWITISLATAAAVLSVLVSREYLELENKHRLLRFESARIGSPGVQSLPADVLILTQLDAFARIARTEARRGMSSDEVDMMRKVAERYGYPPLLLRYALAAGLNGRPDAARASLQILCKVHPSPRCEEGKVSWRALQAHYPELHSVEFPASDDSRLIPPG